MTNVIFDTQETLNTYAWSHSDKMQWNRSAIFMHAKVEQHYTV